MRIPLTLSQPSPPPGIGSWRNRFHSQEVRDKLYAMFVTALVLATIALAAGYAIHEMPRWRAGQIGGFDTTVLPLPDQSSQPGNAAVADSVASNEPGINRTSLMLTSMLVEAAIFVGLGLFLRHEMKPKS